MKNADKDTTQEYITSLTNEYADSLVDIDDVVVLKEAIAEAYLAGLKAGRPQWHDLRKDPKDLPNDERSVWTNEGAGYHGEDGWWDDFGRLQDVIAWCDPKFEK